VSAVYDNKKLNETVHLAYIFEHIDKDNSGTIQLEELREFIKENDVSYLETDINSILHELDENGDGTLTLDEFCSCFDKLLNHLNKWSNTRKENKYVINLAIKNKYKEI